MQNETYLALIGKRVGPFWWGRGHWPAEGRPASVAFDPNLVMEREEQHQDVVGFFHTHPNMRADPSNTDYQTMGAWTVCFGKPLACCIEGRDGLKGHWFKDDEEPHQTTYVIRLGNLFFGVLPKWPTTSSTTKRSTEAKVSSSD